MKRIGAVLVISIAVLGSAVFATHARADTTCRMNAKAALLDCKSQCKSDFLDARFTCRNVLPSCGKACLAGRQQCFDNVEVIKDTGQVPGGTTLDNCSGGTDACKAAFTATATGAPADGGCGATCGPNGQNCNCSGDLICEDCIDGAQVTRFLCRDACGDSFRTNAIVKAMKANCRSTFQACIQACPPAN
ncbi:MAG: hypothetical protein HY271_01195 [Deltaproteobacteria bacterium]|nr:hypothetical protein [Deltaproteobacteria bacterium]